MSLLARASVCPLEGAISLRRGCKTVLIRLWCCLRRGMEKTFTRTHTMKTQGQAYKSECCRFLCVHLTRAFQMYISRMLLMDGIRRASKCHVTSCLCLCTVYLQSKCYRSQFFNCLAYPLNESS